MVAESSEANARWMRRLWLAAYRPKDVAHYAGLRSSRTIARWEQMTSRYGPATPAREHDHLLSYMEMIEIAFVSTFRKAGVSLQRIRKAREYAEREWDKRFPFAHLKFKTDGHHVFLDLEKERHDRNTSQIVVASEYGQVAWTNLVVERFSQFTYEHELALIWRPQKDESPRVLIDPRISFGRPNIRGVPVEALRDRYLAGETPVEIADDFELELREVEQGIEFTGVELVAA